MACFRTWDAERRVPHVPIYTLAKLEPDRIPVGPRGSFGALFDYVFMAFDWFDDGFCCRSSGRMRGIYAKGVCGRQLIFDIYYSPPLALSPVEENNKSSFPSGAAGGVQRPEHDFYAT